MSTNLPRPLTPLERAILRAVVELAEEANGVSVHKMIVTGSGSPSQASTFYLLHILEADGFVTGYYVEGCKGRFWRPAFDLTEVLNNEP